jgi:hypothetical protein
MSSSYLRCIYKISKALMILLSIPLLIAVVIYSIITLGRIYGAIEQRIYVSKVVPVLQEVSAPDDARIKAIEGTDSFGFRSYCWKINLKDGWVVIFEREFVSGAEPSVTWQQWLRHRVIFYRDSAGKLYIKAQGFAPPDDLDQKGESDFEPLGDGSVSDFFKVEKTHVQPGWNFWEIKDNTKNSK